MANTKIKLVRGDTKPQLKVVVIDTDTGVPVDISGSTARLYFRAAGATTLQATVVGTLVTGLETTDPNTGAPIVNTSAPYDVAGAGGRVVFQWGPGDLDCAAGDYEGEIEVSFGDGSKQTVYDTLSFKLREDFAG
jgi:hypothetical protein